MRRRGLGVLALAGGASIGAALVLAPRETPPTGTGGVLAFPGLAARLAQAEVLEIQRNEGTLIIRRAGERWILPDRNDYPIRDSKMRELLTGLTELRLAESRGGEAENFARLGVDDPTALGSTATRLRLLGPQGAVMLEATLGRRRARTQGNVPETVYLRRGSEPEAWLAEGRVPVEADAASWMDRDVANFPAERVRGVTVSRAGTQPITLARNATGLALTDPPDPPQTNRAVLDDVARAFEYLTFMDAMPEAATPGEAQGQARFELSDGLVINVWGSRFEQFLFIRLQAEGGVEAQLLNARWAGWAYQVGIWKERAFLPRLDELTGA
jgi:hypothetical protein